MVAMKFSQEKFSERFEPEAKAISSLNHPNICQLYDVGPNYFVMEYIEGSQLKGPLPLDQELTCSPALHPNPVSPSRYGAVERQQVHGNGLDRLWRVPAVMLNPIGVDTPWCTSASAPSRQVMRHISMGGSLVGRKQSAATVTGDELARYVARDHCLAGAAPGAPGPPLPLPAPGPAPLPQLGVVQTVDSWM